MAERVGRKVLVLDRFRIVVTVFAVGALIILVWLIVLTGRVNRHESTRLATINADYSICVQKIPFLRQVNAFFREKGSSLRVPVPTRRECEKRRERARDA